MKKIIMGMLFFVFVLSITACGAVKNKSIQVTTYSDISPKAAKERLENEEGIILLDVRTLEEYIENHIPGSILIPVDEIRSKAPEILTDKNAEIIVYCRSGRRSVTAAEMLIDMGYTNVYNLGGIIDWPYETESGAPE